MLYKPLDIQGKKRKSKILSLSKVTARATHRNQCGALCQPAQEGFPAETPTWIQPETHRDKKAVTLHTDIVFPSYFFCWNAHALERPFCAHWQSGRHLLML